MFLEKLKCSNCNKEVGKNEVITIKVNERELKGSTMVRNWAKNQTVLCEKCTNK